MLGAKRNRHDQTIIYHQLDLKSKKIADNNISKAGFQNHNISTTNFKSKKEPASSPTIIYQQLIRKSKTQPPSTAKSKPLFQTEVHIILIPEKFWFTTVIYSQLRNIYSQLRKIYLQLRNIYSQLRNIYSQLRNIYSQLWNIYSQLGNIYAQLKNIYSQLWYIYNWEISIHNWEISIHSCEIFIHNCEIFIHSILQNICPPVSTALCVWYEQQSLVSHFFTWDFVHLLCFASSFYGCLMTLSRISELFKASLLHTNYTFHFWSPWSTSWWHDNNDDDCWRW